MQLSAGVGAQADHVACVRRNLGLKQDDGSQNGTQKITLKNSKNS
jgi:hypothetical protein